MMKKVFGIMALALTLAACNKTEVNIPFSATISIGNSPATKALADEGTQLTATWAVGDKVALIHNGVSDEMTVASVTGGVATISGTISGSPADGDAVTVIYPSSAADGATGDVKSDLLYTQNGLLTGEGSIAEKSDVRKGAGTLRVSGTATLGGSVELTNEFAIFKFTVRGADGTTAINTCPLTVTIGTQAYVITPATATDTLYVALPAATEQKVIFDAVDESNKTYTCAKLRTTFTEGNYYQTTLKMREYVLMGEGYNLKWATCNVGGDHPEDYGDYYSWGATSTQSSYNWGHYPYMAVGKSSWEHINKYTFADGQTSGSWYDGSTFKGDNGDGVEHKDLASYDYIDDVARQRWKGTWRTPTAAEWTALRNTDNFTWAWTNDYNGTGAKGRTVTSKVSGYEGNQIFLPAAGYYFTTIADDRGSGGYYWSSSLRANHSRDAQYIRFGSSGKPEGTTCGRQNGQSVRAVAE
jgi:hypothetical protein